jgi:26S proteasome regulatory subunit N12
LPLIKVAAMGALQEAMQLRSQLVNEWRGSGGRAPNLDKCGDLLNRIKVVLTNLKFLPESAASSTREELIIARDVLEIGAFWSIARKDIPSFERYMAQLKCYYLDYKEELPESAYKCELLGLNLLCLLSQNRVAEFHTELELFAHPELHVLDNIYIKHVVALEQYLMEGRYNKIFMAKRQVPSEAFSFFIDFLLDTIRDEISNCVEKSYNRLRVDAASKVLNISGQNLMTYAKKRGWTHSHDGYFYFNTEKKNDDNIPSLELARDAIEYAKELEMIV